MMFCIFNKYLYLPASTVITVPFSKIHVCSIHFVQKTMIILKPVFIAFVMIHARSYFFVVELKGNREYTQKNGAVPKVNKRFISHLTRTQHTPFTAATVQVSHALPSVFSYI
jgi:hypothetical protein